MGAQDYLDETEYDTNNVPSQHTVKVEHITPVLLANAGHFHASMEINILRDCSMTYTFSGTSVEAKERHLIMFWGARPHGVSRITGRGKITNFYITLREFLRWPLPEKFVSALLSGAVIQNVTPDPADVPFARRLASERNSLEGNRNRLHSMELQSRVMRLATDPHECLLDPVHDRQLIDVDAPSQGFPPTTHFEYMLRFISERYANNITVKDVAASVGVSQSYASALFKRFVGKTIKDYLVEVRLAHAKMLLAETDSKILTVAMDSGYNSLSAFYQAFHDHVGTSPRAFREGRFGSDA